MRNRSKSVGAGFLILALTSCAPKAESIGAAAQAVQTRDAYAANAITSVPPASMSTAPAPPRNLFAPMCKVDGCCAGHGEVAYVQRDFAIICTDGQASDICDCHT